MPILVVYVEHSGGAARRASLETIGAACAAGASVTAALAGPGADAVAAALGAAGASKAVVLANVPDSPDALAASLAELVKSEGAQGFLASATSTGKDIAPRVAALLDSALLSDCTGFAAAGAGFRLTRPALAGKLIYTASSSAPVLCATLRRNVFQPAKGGGAAQLATMNGRSDFKALLKSVAAKSGGKLDVGEAPVVVAGGRGLKGPEHFALLEQLAAAFGNAAVGASRAVVDAGWRPHSEQVGQTGKTVAPQLYIAAGISGAIQHLAGMRTSKVIVAINKDAEAPIFKVADYGIVGDALEILPALTQAVKALRAQQ